MAGDIPTVPSLPDARATAREMVDRYRFTNVSDHRAVAEAFGALLVSLGRLLDAHDREEGL